MALSTRRLLRHNIRTANDNTMGDDFQDDPSLRHHISPTKVKSNRKDIQHSTSVLQTLSDPDSELAQFLFVGDDENGSGNGEVEMKSMRSRKVCWYSLALAPMEVRNERVIMLSEAYAIFGALFLGGTWILYEWGSAEGYGGRYGGTDNSKYWDENIVEGFQEYAGRTFEVVMAMLMTSNLFLALFSSVLWLMSIAGNWSNQNWVYESRHLLTFCDYLLNSTLTLVALGLLLGMLSSSNGPETIISIIFCLVIFFVGSYHIKQFQFSMLALELFHLPKYDKGLFFLMGRRREKNRALAKQRAENLREMAYRERLLLDPHMQQCESQSSSNSIGVLLRKAAVQLGRAEYDVSIYVSKLEKDWFNEADQLKEMSEDLLSQYMPRRLAQKVKEILAEPGDPANPKDAGNNTSGTSIEEET